MLYLISYDISTASKAGRTRLRRVAKKCENYGTRVQNSVFECEMRYEIYLLFKKELSELINRNEDNVRIYPMGKGGRERVIHIGIDRSIDMDGPLIF